MFLRLLTLWHNNSFDAQKNPGSTNSMSGYGRGTSCMNW